MNFLLAFTAAGIALFAALELRIIALYWLNHHRLNPVNNLPNPSSETGPELPEVLVQLPIYNEPAVAQQLIQAVDNLNYPRERLTVQVLDDSTDETTEIVAECLASVDPEGKLFHHLHRKQRIGYKAGALQDGLQQSTAEFVAIFDADFLPPCDFLRRAFSETSPFRDETVAFVQGRWTYYNVDANRLTRVQSILMDRHFFMQKPVQQVIGDTLHFNGSAGIWRRSAIEEAGGWTQDTLCEDLDLSYRCALLGYHGVYDAHLICPSEIPPTFEAFKLQQRRWAKGSAQVAAKLMSPVVQSDRIRNVVSELHVLLGYMIHPFILLFTLIWPWSVTTGTGNSFLWACQGALIFGNIAAFTGFLSVHLARKQGEDRLLRHGLMDVAASMIVGTALMVNNSAAFAAGVLRRHGEFERTPKSGQSSPTFRRERRGLHWIVWLEIALAIYGLTAGAVLFSDGYYIWGQQSLFMGGIMASVLGIQGWRRIRLPAAEKVCSPREKRRRPYGRQP